MGSPSESGHVGSAATVIYLFDAIDLILRRRPRVGHPALQMSLREGDQL